MFDMVLNTPLQELIAGKELRSSILALAINIQKNNFSGKSNCESFNLINWVKYQWNYSDDEIILSWSIWKNVFLAMSLFCGFCWRILEVLSGSRNIYFLIKGTIMQIEKALINDCLCVSKVSWKFHIPTIDNFAVIYPWNLLFSLKEAYFLTVSISKTLRLNNLKTRTAMNAKMSVFVICIEAIYCYYII